MIMNKKDDMMQNAKHHTIWSDELGATRDIRISVAELQLIANQVRDSNNDQLDFLYDMILTAIDDASTGLLLLATMNSALISRLEVVLLVILSSNVDLTSDTISLKAR
jgi:hypothetical protein